MKLILIRHGQSEANVDKNVYLKIFDHNIPLSEQGRQEAKELGLSLYESLWGKRVEFHVSPYRRTEDTATLIANELTHTSIEKVIYNPILREQEWPMIDNNAAGGVLKEREDFGEFWYRFRGFESEADVYLRAQIYYNDLRIKQMQGKLEDTVVIVSHHIFLSCLVGVIKSVHPDNIIIDLKNCIPYELEI
jgi:broad specificity phosphatase PhoE